MTYHEQAPPFSGSIPEVYDRYLVPMIFESYAEDIVARLGDSVGSVESVLEIAAGTGVVTRVMAARLSPSTAITATDLNPDMIERGMAVGTGRPVTWQQADGMELPFDDESFDAVACQFGAMFFADQRRAFSEVWRVLRPGGRFLFSVWDRIEANDFSLIVNDTVATVFPGDPPTFLSRFVHGYHDASGIQADLAASGFGSPARFDALDASSRAASALDVATAYCKGGPLRGEIEARDASLLSETTLASEAAIRDRFGSTEVEGKIRAYVISASKAS